MTDEDFTRLSLLEKWNHIENSMSYIARMDSVYSMRVRLNPHHPEEDKKEEARNVRLDQYNRWVNIKDLYAAHRDELSDTRGDPSFEESKSILERIFSTEVDDALRSIISDEK